MNLNTLVALMKPFCRVMHFFFPDSLHVLVPVFIVPMQNWLSTIETNALPSPPSHTQLSVDARTDLAAAIQIYGLFFQRTQKPISVDVATPFQLFIEVFSRLAQSHAVPRLSLCISLLERVRTSADNPRLLQNTYALIVAVTEGVKDRSKTSTTTPSRRTSSPLTSSRAWRTTRTRRSAARRACSWRCSAPTPPSFKASSTPTGWPPSPSCGETALYSSRTCP